MTGRHLLAALALLALLVPLGVPQFWVFIAIEVLAFALYAVSFNVLLGFGGMLSFGHAAFFGMGAYTVAILSQKAGLPVLAALALAPAATAVLALVIGYFSVRRLGIYFAMLTFAFQMLLFTVAMKWTAVTGGDDGITGLKAPGVLADPVVYYYFVFVIVAASLYALHRLVRSPFGYTLRALRTNPRRVTYVGVDVRRHQLATFVITGVFAGIAGALFAISSGNVFPDWLAWTRSATPVVMAVLGGIHTFFGPVIGAAVYVLLEVYISGKTEYWPLFMGIVILVLVLAMPEGLSGFRWMRRMSDDDR